ncbi:MAG: thioredoxin family protein [Flavobacteriales bacterium]|nr:thioredoxin family protein [Flavobacteriales bacterium]
MRLKIFLLFCLSLFSINTFSEGIVEPVKWTWEINKVEGSNEAEVVFTSFIDSKWHIYSRHLADGFGEMLGTAMTFEPHDSYALIDSVIEGESHSKDDPLLGITILYFENEAKFIQKVMLNDPENFTIKGSIMSSACNDEGCLPPEFKDFLLTAGGAADVDVGEVTGGVNCEDNPYFICNVDMDNPVEACGEEHKTEESLWSIFILGMIGGLIALITPCVFPMIPLTVSFFTKGSEDRGKAIRRSATYGFFIMVIYFLLSIPFLVAPDVDPEILSMLSTNPWLNLGFFVIFIVFAFSFFGYFELVLPQKWANKMDSASDVGGIIGTFFMALTLAIVSFSCTGPILGSLLAGTLASEGADVVSFAGMEFQMVAVKLSMGMTGFGLALGMPFALFAAFPSMLAKLPQSGGWLNSVKVVLGFLEIALAIKFLSNADLVEQWGLVKRETFFVFWFIVSVAAGLYMLGKIKFPHDSQVTKLSGGRLAFAGLFLGFALYLVPGILGKQWWNHNLLSGFPPPMYYAYVEHEHEVKVFKDYEEGMAYAKENDKPVMLDFTGWACVNCRKMEDNVWVLDEVKEKLNNDFVVISLYVDERTAIAGEEQEVVLVPTSGGGTKKKKLRTVGDRWATLEALTFQSSTQPLYVILNHNEELLTNPIGYSYGSDVDQFKAWLECGAKAFEDSKPVFGGGSNTLVPF